MMMDFIYIFLREDDHSFCRSRFTFNLEFREVFNTQDLASVPYTCITGFPDPTNSSCYGVKCVAHKFTTLALGSLFHFVGPGDSYVISPSRVRLVWRMGGVTLHIFFEVPLLD